MRILFLSVVALAAVAGGTSILASQIPESTPDLLIVGGAGLMGFGAFIVGALYMILRRD